MTSDQWHTCDTNLKSRGQVQALMAWGPWSNLVGSGGKGKLGLTCLGSRDEGRVPLAVLPVDINMGALC